jgi:uncharacterized protein (DUF362 family)/NAD-dependent dihydropyrimidine dehydrogenase PreA subunit
MARTDKVAIARVESNDYGSALKRVKSLLSDFPKLPRGKPVILKPNFVAPRKDYTAAITDLRLVESVAEEVKESGACPVIVETPGMEYVLEEVYDFLDLKGFAENCGISLCSGKENLVRVRIVGGKALGSIKVAKVLTEAPIINIPKFKAHPLTKLSFGMKNLMGALPPAERARMHVRGIHQSIVDINRVIKPVLTIVDANKAMEGDSVYGDRVDLGLLIAGTDTLSVDVACCRIINVLPQNITHIRLAMRDFSFEEMQVIGDIPQQFCTFNLPKKGKLYGFASRLMYIADAPFHPIFGIPFNRFLYSTGLFGTRPEIDKQKCTRCGKCTDICTIDGAITLESQHIDYKKCIRCLECINVCPERALKVRGLTKPSKMS